MRFFIHSVDDGHIPPFEYVVCGNITPKAGMALTQTAGKLAMATGATMPKYISMLEADVAMDGKAIPVIRVEPGIQFATTNSAALTSVNPGDKVTIATDGMRVTATTTSGVAEIIEKSGNDAGSDVVVRFSV